MKSRVIVSLFLILASSALAGGSAFTEKDVIGRWYRGDHLGYNLVLIIARDHTYKAKWSGDVIDSTGDSSYGKASGKWSLQRDRLIITPAKESKDTAGDLKSMRVVRQHRKVYLAPLQALKVPTVFHLDPMMVFERDE